MIKEKAKMKAIEKFTFVSNYEQVIGDLPKFIDTHYFTYILGQNKVYTENNFSISHFYTKNQFIFCL